MSVIKQWWGRCTTRSTRWTIYQQNFLADFPASQCSRGSWKPWEFFCTIRTWSLWCPQKKKLYNNLLFLLFQTCVFMCSATTKDPNFKIQKPKASASERVWPFGASDMVKWGYPEETIKNAVQTPLSNSRTKSNFVAISGSISSRNNLHFRSWLLMKTFLASAFAVVCLQTIQEFHLYRLNTNALLITRMLRFSTLLICSSNMLN